MEKEELEDLVAKTQNKPRTVTAGGRTRIREGTQELDQKTTTKKGEGQGKSVSKSTKKTCGAKVDSQGCSRSPLRNNQDQGQDTDLIIVFLPV